MDDDIVREVEPEILRSFYGSADSGNAHNYHCGSVSFPSVYHEGFARRNDGHIGYHDSSNVSWGARPLCCSTLPVYENSSEGTCCGYLLLYEAVDGLSDADSAFVAGAATTDWISEERDIVDSDDEPGERHHTLLVDRVNDDDEVLQSFEQRCVQRKPSPQPGSPVTVQVG